ncbi:hypothetical protein ACOMHN_047071 [Nucella lapillus]
MERKSTDYSPLKLHYIWIEVLFPVDPQFRIEVLLPVDPQFRIEVPSVPCGSPIQDRSPQCSLCIHNSG